MSSFVQSDIFFFITSISVVLVTGFILIMLWYVIRILKNVQDVSEVVKDKTFSLAGDVAGMGEGLKKLFQSFVTMIEGKIKRSKKK